MQITVLNNWESLGSSPAYWNRQWDTLVAQSVTSSIFQALAFNQCWWRNFGSEGELRLLIAHEGERLLGIAPLAIFPCRINFRPERVLGFIGTLNYSADYGDFIVPPGDPSGVIPAFARWIAEHRQDWTVVDLFNWPGHAPHRKAFAGVLNGLGLPSDDRILYDAPARILGRNPDDDKQTVNKKSLKRHTNALKRDGVVEFLHYTSVEAAQADLETFFEQHVGRRAAAHTSSQFHNPRERAFYKDLIQTLLPPDHLRFSTLRFNGNPIAFHFGFEYLGVYTWYKPSFDVAHTHRSPGEVLIKNLLEHCLAKGLKEFDFTVGNESFKYRFANEVRKITRYRVYRSRLSYLLMRVRWVAGSVFRQILRKKS